ncbi:hypothetical protein BDZ97DRAFT_1926769 [Flammula alnicola]|nr:hypothetical protein BDZ97DRAFT_1926769 [Flammula alnicola]
MSKIDPSQVVNLLTLTAILSALREYGINVTSPAQEMLPPLATRSNPNEAKDGTEVPFDVLISALQGMGISITGTLRAGDTEDTSTGTQTENRAVPIMGPTPRSPWAKGRFPPVAVSLAGDIAASMVAAHLNLMDPEPAAPAAGTITASAAAAAATSDSEPVAPAAAPVATPTIVAASPVAPTSTSEDVQSGPTGFLCTYCNAYNIVISSSEIFYTVTAVKRPRAASCERTTILLT